MTRLEELSHEIREKQDELNDLVDELRDLKGEPEEIDDKRIVRPIPLAMYVSKSEEKEINRMRFCYEKRYGIGISRSTLMRLLCLYYLDNYQEIDLSFYQ